MELSQLEKLYNYRRSPSELGEEAAGTPWSCSYRLQLLFHWIASLDVPMLEDETPPPSFYFDLMQDKAVELGRSIHSGKLLVTLGSQTEDGVEPQPEVLELSTPGAVPAAQCHVGSGGVVPLPMLMEIGTGPDLEHVDEVPLRIAGTDLAHIPTMVDMGTGPEPNPIPTAVDLPHGNRRPSSCESVSAVLMKTVLALSLLHALYVLSLITYEAYFEVMPVTQTSSIEETPPFLFAGLWQFIVAMLADLRALLP